MRKNLILLTFFILSTFISLGQGLMNHFEIWGYNGTTEDFVKKYKEKCGGDLYKTYSCMAILGQMGYTHSISREYNNNPLAMLIGKTDYDLVDRLTIVRQISENKYTNMASDKSWQISTMNLYSNIKLKDRATTTQLMAKNNAQLRDLLIGTLTVNKNIILRDNCRKLLDEKIDFSKINLSSTEFEILGSMLSFPDPPTCYCAMKIISKNNIKSKEIFFKEGAETLKDFLKSNLYTFKTDAKNFLIELEPKGKNWSSYEWIKWIEK
jgi:hypothetical protein